MLDLQRPVARLARRFRPTGGHGSVQGSLGLKSGVGAASGGASSAAPTKRSHFFVLVTNFCVSFSLVTSRVLVASACPSKGGRGQLRRSPFPSLMRLRHPGVKLEHKGHIYFTIVDFFIIQNGCYCSYRSNRKVQFRIRIRYQCIQCEIPVLIDCNRMLASARSVQY